MRKHPKVERSQYIGQGMEVDTIRGSRQKAALAIVRHAVEVHPEGSLFRADMHIRGGNMTVATDVTQLENAPFVYLPRAMERVRIRHANERSLVVRKVQVVSPQGVRNPVRYTNQRGSIDIVTDLLTQFGVDDGVFGESGHTIHVLPFSANDKISGLSVCILIIEIGILPQEFQEFRLSPEFVQS
ncbi:MAG: hypothetical protein K9L23_13905 [Desulfotignum sp.]|nr:hypothetical protein [Desulfotignum sp.]